MKRTAFCRRTVGALLSGCALLGGCGPSERAAPEAQAPEHREILFTDVTEDAGLASFRHVNGERGDKWLPETIGAGCAFVDLDGDGWEDIVLIGGGAWDRSEDAAVRKLQTFRNSGDGTFAPTGDIGLGTAAGYGFGITAADIDNDGDQDLLYTSLGPDALFRNDGGVFVDVTAQAGLAAPPSWSTSAIFFDADRDGWVDLYVGGYVAWSPEEDLWCSPDGEHKGYCTPEIYRGVSGSYFRNVGGGLFEDRTEPAGFGESTGKTLGVSQLDFNRDGWPDLVLANDTEPDALYRNNGEGSFSEVGVVSGLAFDEAGKARAGMGVDVGVVDDSGEETVFVGNFSNEMIAVYRHIGHGVFQDRAASSGIGRPSLVTLTFSVLLFDADLDGDLDLFAGNGHVQPHIERVTELIRFRQPPHLFLNDGSGGFTDVAPEHAGVLARPMLVRGTAYADFDRDGDLDILLVENGGPAHLLRNDSNAGRSLRVRLRGTRSNRDGLGAEVVVKTGDRSARRRVRTGSGYLSRSELTATFAFADGSPPDSLVVSWPSGHVDRMVAPSAGEVLVTEGSVP